MSVVSVSVSVMYECCECCECECCECHVTVIVMCDCECGVSVM